jgi:8-oxo-dGTP pyrophosphatase MutT (NUDIX family)
MYEENDGDDTQFYDDSELEEVSKNKTLRPNARAINKKFKLKHVFRGGAVVWTKYNGQDYYSVFRSKSRPNRGVQIPGGRIERNENPAEGIIREVYEETGIETKIICPLGMIYFENPDDNYSSLQIYYLVRPTKHFDVRSKWQFTDKDNTHQELECWFEPIDKDPEFLSAGQSEVIYMFRQWLDEHKKDANSNSDSTKSGWGMDKKKRNRFNPKGGYKPNNKSNSFIL